MADVEALCPRVIVIHRGRILFDGARAALVERFSADKTIAVELEGGPVDLSGYGQVVEQRGERIALRVPKAETARITGRLLADLRVRDLTVESPSIEDVIDQVFREEKV
jgi:ABC-2 type transport system ATP-binding protein